MARDRGGLCSPDHFAASRAEWSERTPLHSTPLHSTPRLAAAGVLGLAAWVGLVRGPSTLGPRSPSGFVQRIASA